MKTLVGGMVALGLVLHAGTAQAALWCAQKLVAHEWGVQIFDGAGGRKQTEPSLLPPWFHTQGPAVAAQPARVADLPADTGVRKLPVLHFYAPESLRESIPLGVGVGFLHGAARVWFPQVDVARASEAANSPTAQTIRTAIEHARRLLTPHGPRPMLPDDPTRQLQWSQLQLTAQSTHMPKAGGPSWIAQARQIAAALWVGHGAESERFVFYEAGTTERVALKLARGPRWSNAQRQYVLTNSTPQPVHDVRISHREGATTWVAFAPEIGAGKSVTVVLSASVPEATRDALRARWLAAAPSASQPREACVMNRDPAVPFEKANGHRLYTGELDLLLSVWAGAIFESSGTTIAYREDVGYLDRVMPLSLFSSMHYFVELNRFSLAIWQNVVLP